MEFEELESFQGVITDKSCKLIDKTNKDFGHYIKLNGVTYNYYSKLSCIDFSNTHIKELIKIKAYGSEIVQLIHDNKEIIELTISESERESEKKSNLFISIFLFIMIIIFHLIKGKKVR
jgi:hypothetical protein